MVYPGDLLKDIHMGKVFFVYDLGLGSLTHQN